MIRVCDKCGRDYASRGAHLCSDREPVNDNPPDKVVPFNDKEWRREYMRRYMRERRLKMREARK